MNKQSGGLSARHSCVKRKLVTLSLYNGKKSNGSAQHQRSQFWDLHGDAHVIFEFDLTEYTCLWDVVQSQHRKGEMGLE